ncbi:zinc finger protein 433-like [Topomyia yanbarensis]|uniref:zinc finger protein 433-like n=1 Tax=Topomyia yanbarensis TaxID=2498891 RepID=UPI00273B0578|nr:zinc finger protein 433-like [Topomyia yanbarensis]
MPKNNLSQRYNYLLHSQNNLFDNAFCEMFWSPFKLDLIESRTRSGCIRPQNETCSISADPIEPITVNFHDEWIELEYRTAQCNIDSDTDSKPEESSTENADSSFEKPYKCEKCSKRFNFPNQLRNHWITHSDQRNYICDCGKRFKTKTYLGIHRRNTGHHDWSIICPRCSKPFAKAAYLARHSETACEKYLAKRNRS